MTLSDLSPAQLSALYATEMKAAFPPDELKPLKSMLTLMEGGRYEALGMYDEEGLHGYALTWLEPGIPFALLDYFGTLEGQRGNGLGTRMLDLLAEHYRDYRGIFGEAEGPFSPDPEEAKLQQRRQIPFTQRPPTDLHGLTPYQRWWPSSGRGSCPGWC